MYRKRDELSLTSRVEREGRTEVLGRDEMLGAGSLVPAGGAEVLEAEALGGLLFDDNTLHPVDVPGEAVRGRAAGDEEGVEEAVRAKPDVRDEPTARHSCSIA